MTIHFNKIDGIKSIKKSPEIPNVTSHNDALSEEEIEFVFDNIPEGDLIPPLLNFSVSVLEENLTAYEKTPVKITNDLWIVHYDDLPLYMQVELNPEIGFFIIQPSTLDFSKKTGFKALRELEKVPIDAYSTRFSQDLISNLEGVSIERKDDGFLISRGNISNFIGIETNLSNVSVVSPLMYSLESSLRNGIKETNVSRAVLEPLLVESDPRRKKDFYINLFDIVDKDLLEELKGDLKLEHEKTCAQLGLKEQICPLMLFGKVNFFGNYNTLENTLRITEDLERERIKLIDVLNIQSHETYHASRTVYAAMFLYKNERREIVVNSLFF